jgi:hypothetical protein
MHFSAGVIPNPNPPEIRMGGFTLHYGSRFTNKTGMGGTRLVMDGHLLLSCETKVPSPLIDGWVDGWTGLNS